MKSLFVIPIATLVFSCSPRIQSSNSAPQPGALTVPAGSGTGVSGLGKGPSPVLLGVAGTFTVLGPASGPGRRSMPRAATWPSKNWCSPASDKSK